MEELTPEQKELYDVVGRGRAQVAGPFGVWLRNPPLADAANRVTLALRENGKLDKRLFELIVLTAARAWGASYAWVAHEKPAIKAGSRPRSSRRSAFSANRTSRTATSVSSTTR